MSKEVLWTHLWGKPEKIYIETYKDDYGCWDESYSREDGPLGFKPSPLELYQTKKACQQAMEFKSKLQKEYTKARKKVAKEVYGDLKSDLFEGIFTKSTKKKSK